MLLVLVFVGVALHARRNAFTQAESSRIGQHAPGPAEHVVLVHRHAQAGHAFALLGRRHGRRPVQCVGSETWNVDLNVNYEINDHASVYLNVLNVLGIDPPVDYSAAYSIFQYNPAWAQPNIVGRYFRIGAKVDF